VQVCRVESSSLYTSLARLVIDVVNGKERTGTDLFEHTARSHSIGIDFAKVSQEYERGSGVVNHHRNELMSHRVDPGFEDDGHAAAGDLDELVYVMNPIYGGVSTGACASAKNTNSMSLAHG
jgi:hypothetical protein